MQVMLQISANAAHLADDLKDSYLQRILRVGYSFHFKITEALHKMAQCCPVAGPTANYAQGYQA